MIGFGIFILGVLLFFVRPKKKKIPAAKLRQFVKEIENTNALDPNHALMESHKIFVAAVKTLFPEDKGTAAQTLNKVCDRFPNEKSVWRLHRLRNQAAHQTNFTVYEKTAGEARTEFVRALRSLG